MKYIEFFDKEPCENVIACLSLGEAGKYIRQRAGDMKIRIIDDIHTLSDEEIEKKLRTLWQS